MPEIAAGTTMRVETWSLLAPSAYAPSRRSCGTAVMASSESEATVGMQHDAHDEACARAR